MISGYYLGCPGWGLKGWVGRLFEPGTKDRDFLARYAEVFNTVEGNTTFYALPTTQTVARWDAQVPDSFRFCFKFPRTITHDRLLVDCDDELATFLARISPLEPKLGVLMAQLPPRFGPEHLGQLRAFLDRLPRGLRYAVELRHAAFFEGDAADREAIELLTERGVDLVILDARGIHTSTSLVHAATRDRKPNLPVHVRATGPRPIVRCVPHESFATCAPLAQAWSQQVWRWIADGKQPYFFMHSPDDTVAPENAYAFHAMLRAHGDVGELPPWPGTPRQQTLF